MRNLAQVSGPRVHCAGLEMSEDRTPGTEIHDRADAALLRKPSPSLGPGVSLSELVRHEVAEIYQLLHKSDLILVLGPHRQARSLFGRGTRHQ